MNIRQPVFQASCASPAAPPTGPVAQVHDEVKETVIPGLLLIEHNARNYCVPDDPSYPYLLDMRLAPPGFMAMAFVAMHGGAEILRVRSLTLEALQQFVDQNDFRRHPRLYRLTITGPDGIVEQASLTDLPVRPGVKVL
jgi:hypothetical protein